MRIDLKEKLHRIRQTFRARTEQGLLSRIDLGAALVYALLLLGMFYALRAAAASIVSVSLFIYDFYPIFVLLIWPPALLKYKEASRLGLLGALLGMIVSELAAGSAPLAEPWYSDIRLKVFLPVFFLSYLLGFVLRELRRKIEADIKCEKN